MSGRSRLPRSTRRHPLPALAIVVLLAAVLGPLLVGSSTAAHFTGVAAARGASAAGTKAVSPTDVVTGAPAASSGARPLIVVVDTSASMADGDGTGTIKLAGARRALSDLVREQYPGTQMGLYTYPGGPGGCSPGGYQVEVHGLVQRPFIDAVRGLTATGDTPTGPALLAAVHDTEQVNPALGATVLLISDGESNCGPPPCRVAERLVDEGFDITVQALGFRISGAGLRELRCIANATGGGVYTADNVDELQSTIEELTSPQLDLTVSAPEQVAGGMSATVSVRVSNKTAQDIVNAQVALNFAGDPAAAGSTAEAVVPAVLPPRVLLANLPAGESVTQEWRVTFGIAGRGGEAHYRATAWGDAAAPVSKTGRVVVTSDHLSFTNGGQALSFLQDGPVAILGDSYSAGEGTGSYVENLVSDRAGELGYDCHRSEQTYLAPLVDEINLACSGATSDAQTRIRE